MNPFFQDVKYAGRTLARSPGFSAAAVATLALGIGTAATIFAGVDALFLRALSLPSPERLVTLWAARRTAGFDHANVSYRDFEDWRRESKSFEAMAAILTTGPTLTGSGEPEAFDAALVTGDFFALLGVRPLRGRLIEPSDDSPASPRVVVLSWQTWQRRFGADPGILGATLVFDGQPATVIGILPRAAVPGFELNQAWMALGPDLGDPARGDRSFLAFGRLRPGVSIEKCRAELDALSRRLAAAYPDTNTGLEVNVLRMTDDLFGGKFRTGLFTLLAAVGLVLLIACANIAQLLLVRGAAREREMAVRAALGASRARVVRQMLTEHLLLAFVGGGLGLLLSAWGVEIFVRLLPQDTARLPEVGLDARVSLFGLALSAATAVAFGLLPALHVSRAGLSGPLQAASVRGTPGRRRVRVQALLVATEVALALVVLSGAGLLAKSLSRLRLVDPGFRAEGVLTARIDLAESETGSEDRLRAFHDPLLESIARLPGVRAAASVSTLPMTGNNSWTFVEPEGRPPAPLGQEPRVGRIVVSPDYFRAMGIPILQGRSLLRTDGASAPRVAVVNQEMAEMFWPGQNAVGKRFRRGRASGDAAWIEVVGIAANVRHRGLTTPVRPEMFFPFDQRPGPSMHLVVSSQSSNPASLVGAVRREVYAARPGQAVSSIRTMGELVTADTASERLLTRLISAFAAAALALSTMGLYAVVALAVRQGRREIGIRMALGAVGGDVIRLVLRRWMFLALVGLLAGLGATLALGRLVSGLLYEVRPADASVLSAISAVIALVTLAASYLPARQAARIDPAAALRSE
jgi:putative ABC transport system permease protein